MLMTKILAFNRDRRPIRPDSEGRHIQGGGTEPARRRADARNKPAVVSHIHEARAPNVEISASIVVPTRGRPELLNRCLASLVLQRFDPARFEIIVVDDEPSDDTRDVVTGWASHTAGTGPRIIYIPSMGPHGPAAARNFGWRAARGNVIAFTDDDTIAKADWLTNGFSAFEEGVDAVCGRIVMPLSHTPTDYELDAKHLETAEFVTANCFCRKKVLESLGGFDERFRFAWREDSDLHFRLLEHNSSIVREPRAVMIHPIRPAGWGVSLSQVKKMQFDALLFKKHPALYRSRIRAQPRWDFYMTVAALLVMVAAAIAGMPLLAIAAGSVWFYMTARFCILRLKKTSKAPMHVLEMIVTSVLIPPLAVFWRAIGALKFRVGFL
jgi:hypothetical protein